ncbi:MAG: hypothetical protein ACRDPY_33655 [Streptosporangiaceae bacterium]
MSGFSNPIIGGGGALVYPSIHSPDYVTEVSGWTVSKDGSAEFSDVTIRGTILAATIIGALIENSAADPKTSIAADGSVSITNAAGVIIFGISPAGILTWYSAAGAVLMQMSPAGILSITDPALVEFPSGAAFENTAAQITSQLGGTSPAQYINTQIRSASAITAGARDLADLSFNSAAEDNSSSANLDFIYIGSNGTEHEYAFLDITGLNILAGSIIAAHPGSSPAVPESWQTLTLENGYTAGTNNGFTDDPMVRVAADNKNLQFKGTLKAPASGYANPFAALPSGYPNANFGGPYGKAVVANLTGSTVDHLQVQNNGNLQLEAPAASISYDLSCTVATQ